MSRAQRNAALVGRTGVLSTHAGASRTDAEWSLPVRIEDVHDAYGRTRYTVVPVAPLSGGPIRVDASRVTLDPPVLGRAAEFPRWTAPGVESSVPDMEHGNGGL